MSDEHDFIDDPGFSFEGDDPESREPGKRSVMMSLEGYTFDTLVGFDDEIARLREAGIVQNPDPDYIDFVMQMKAQHGMHDEPIGNAVLFRCDVRDDADRLMLAAANELGNPIIRIKVVEGLEGMQAMYVMATPGLGADGFDGPGTLIIDGIDAWDGPAGFELSLPQMQAMAAASSNGALKTISLIRNAASDPQVTIFASACGSIDRKSPIALLIGPMAEFAIPAPNAAERDAIWDHLMDKHVSMSALDRHELVVLSRGMPRCDIFAAAHEAVAQAYRSSLQTREYVPVTRSNLLEKVAAYQPLDSEEYRKIEDSVVEDFLVEIERYEREDS